jgi:hypothetical protein
MPYNPLLQQQEGNENTNNNNATRPTFGERLGFLAVTITAIGDILAVISAGILIEEGIAEEQQSGQEKKEQEQQLSKMQDQIASLQKELQSIKKQQK